MKNRAVIAISVLIMLYTAGCSANMDNAGLQGRNNSNAGSGLTYDREREDYPGQTYTNMISGTAPQDLRTGGGSGAAGDNMPAGNNTTAGNNIADGNSASGITATQLSAGDHPSEGGGIILRSIKSPVRRGETGSLSIQGKADTQYTITAVYKNSGDVITTTVVRQSDANGIVDLSWDVSADTAPGTYGIMITGGGEQLTVSYTVTE